MSEPLLVLDKVVKRFGNHVAVDGVDLQITKGEFLAIMGPSGCGKTTTLRMIAGLELPSEGEIRLNGTRMNEFKPWQRDTPLVWQNLALFPHLNVLPTYLAITCHPMTHNRGLWANSPGFMS